MPRGYPLRPDKKETMSDAPGKSEYAGYVPNEAAVASCRLEANATNQTGQSVEYRFFASPLAITG